ncbi:hypothetical protein V1478_000437 [Vespula squamosa]|uniref:Uncharacterized protein n=1 Tax=Vespula squamosa TaxID=30214 RepID=A0ABD2C5G8_VESSQ
MNAETQDFYRTRHGSMTDERIDLLCHSRPDSPLRSKLVPREALSSAATDNVKDIDSLVTTFSDDNDESFEGRWASRRASIGTPNTILERLENTQLRDLVS